MTAFDDTFAEQCRADYLSQFGEPIVYVPKNGTPRTIALAVVDRNPPEDLSGPSSGHGPMLTVDVADDAATGIARSELNTGGDRIDVAVRKGGTAKSMMIQKLLSDVGGMLALEVR